MHQQAKQQAEHQSDQQTEQQASAAESRTKRCLTLFLIFLEISSVTLGGGLAMLPLMTHDFVEKRHWLTDKDMVDTIAVMQSLPGIISINMGVLIGYKVAGIPGAIASAFGVILTPFIAIILIAIFVSNLTFNKTLSHIFLGVRSAVAAMILLSAISLSRQILTGWFTTLIAIVGFFLITFTNFSVILLIVIAASLGLARAYVPFMQKRSARQ